MCACMYVRWVALVFSQVLCIVILLFYFCLLIDGSWEFHGSGVSTVFFSLVNTVSVTQADL